ncbi:chemotaxis protein CheW [Pseudalkalibacillus salsuginis]|uniref:chemotaxis protein CheW n=1 Tax=Pseudalkalibacillus salsuginis TaxID=2910972 RepID=UPI001F28720F|nr:chemotaxis protein CheW [Pseudalkalibacillus salsuginis]MCF6410589.1 chemotaxis protein CheW [Pseudalkalibacillus salsuginis]
MSEMKTVETEMKAIVFQLLDEEYGVDVHQVRSIERIQEITRVPRTPSFVKGVINLRGIVTPIIDLRSRFDLVETTYTDETRIVIVNVNDLEVGMIVDSANDVIDVPADSVEPPPKVVGGIEAEYLDGVAKLEKRLLILLNLERVLNPEEIITLRQFKEKSE